MACLIFAVVVSSLKASLASTVFCHTVLVNSISSYFNIVFSLLLLYQCFSNLISNLIFETRQCKFSSFYTLPSTGSLPLLCCFALPYTVNQLMLHPSECQALFQSFSDRSNNPNDYPDNVCVTN